MNPIAQRMIRPPHLAEIVLAVCAAAAVEPAELKSWSRSPAVLLARKASLLLARHHTGASFPQIAAWLSASAAHSTVVTMAKRTRWLMDNGKGEPVVSLCRDAERRLVKVGRLAPDAALYAREEAA